MRLFSTFILAFGLHHSVAIAGPSLIVEKEARLLDVTGVSLEGKGLHYGYDAYVNVRFGNSCFVPQLEDIILAADYQRNNITYTLASKLTDTVCNLRYEPIDMTFIIPGIINPADGRPKLTVNGIAPRLSSPVISGEVVELDQSYSASLLKIDNVKSKLSTSRADESKFEELQIIAEAVFSNRCHVPSSEDLYRIRDFSLTGELNIQLVHKPAQVRLCPTVYKPVRASIEVLTESFLNNPIRVSVNGIYAR